MSIETRFEQGRSLASLSTFGIGGKARLFITIDTIEQMIEVKRYCIQKHLPYWVVGKGSNSLFDDRGFDGLVILNKIDFIELKEGNLHVGAGTSFSLLGAQMARKGWSGLEFASGIPGSVGGAVYMNAGANGMETCDSLTHVGVVDQTGNYIERKKDGLAFSYRFSSFQKTDEIIVSARFCLERKEAARSAQLKIIEYRRATQPYGEKSVGCIFRNPEKEKAGALIEACGLKGKRIGGAEVSTLHANFIINRANATTEDVLSLARFVQDTIRKEKGVDLEMEVRPVPFSLEEQ